MTVVTMWLPFSRYISATPLMARLMDSVPPEVNTISLGSRAPISLAIWARAVSTPLSASQPKEWLRLAGCPNFSVKYGIIASTTLGSTGVVDCASMKIGNFNAIGSFSPSSCSSSAYRQQLRHVLARQLRQTHRVEDVGDGGLDPLHGAAQRAPLHLLAARVLQAAHDVDRPFEGPDHLAHRDVVRPPGQHVTALGTVLAHDQPFFRETLEDLGHDLRRNVRLLRDPLGPDRPEVVVDGDIMNRHQPVVGALGKAEHLFAFVLVSPAQYIPDVFSRRLNQSESTMLQSSPPGEVN